jgi:sulfur-carrier protein
MAVVHLPSGWTEHTGGIEELTIDAPRVDELMAALTRRFPGLTRILEQSAVAIDGQVYHHARYQALRPDSEVHLLPAISGGTSGL